MRSKWECRDTKLTLNLSHSVQLGMLDMICFNGVRGIYRARLASSNEA